jgi:endoglucanase
MAGAYQGVPARDVSGGHHDANDCGKYIIPSCYSMYLLMQANKEFNLSSVKLDIPESGNSMPDILNEVKWELLSMMKFQDADGGLFAQTYSASWTGWKAVMWKKAYRAAAVFCATMATAKREFQPYDPAFADKCWNAAKSAYGWMKANPNYKDDLPNYGDYGPTGSLEEKTLWAACELWVTADAFNLPDKAAYLSDAEAKIKAFKRGYNNGYVQTLTDYWEPENAGLVDYYFHNSSSRNSTLVKTIHDQILTCADQVVSATQGYGRALALAQNRGMVAYPWGGTAYTTWGNHILWAANKISPNAKYTNAALGNIGFIYGRNYFNKSFQSAVGFNPVTKMFYHIGSSLCPGLVIDGINSYGSKGNKWDENGDFTFTEPALNYTAMTAYALGMFVESSPVAKGTAGEPGKATGAAAGQSGAKAGN